jgi:hypothetical protein
LLIFLPSRFPGRPGKPARVTRTGATKMDGIKVSTEWNERRVCILMLTASLYRGHGPGSRVHWSAGGYDFFKAVAQQFTNLNLTHEGHANERISDKYRQLSTDQVNKTRTTFACLAEVNGFLHFVDEQVKSMNRATQQRCKGYATYTEDGIQSMFNEECSSFSSAMLAKKTVVRSSTTFFVVSLTWFYNHRR